MSVATLQDIEVMHPPGPRVDSLADTVVLLLALTVVQRGIGFLRGVLFCRWLDPEQLGEWDLAYGFLLLAAPLAVLGLPGSFGRYVEYYRQRGQLRSFLKQTTTFTLLLSLVAIVVIAAAAPWFSELVFGRSDRADLILLMAGSLGIIIAYNFLVELFTALRLFRFISLLQFAHSMLFAAGGLGLLLGWQATAASVVLSYAVACLVCSLVSLVWLSRTWKAMPVASGTLSQSTLLAKLMPFAVWVWATNWLSNLFDIVDRYMIVHHSGLEAAEALAQVGNYHSSRVVPMLLVTIATMLATVALPHMSHDWEAGRRAAVSQRVNLMLKLVTFAVMVGGVAILAASYWIFEVALAGKYSGGLAVLPLTITYSAWFGVVGLAQNYLWCAEKARLGSLAVLVGVVVNVALNLVLLPRFGLVGAVAATAIANLAAFALTCVFAHGCGLKFDLGTWLIVLLPGLFYLGSWITGCVLVLYAIAAVQGNLLLNAEEKSELAAIGQQYIGRARNLVGLSR